MHLASLYQLLKGQGYCISAIIEANGKGEDSISIHLKFREAQMKLDKKRHNQQASGWLSGLVNSKNHEEVAPLGFKRGMTWWVGILMKSLNICSARSRSTPKMQGDSCPISNMLLCQAYMQIILEMGHLILEKPASYDLAWWPQIVTLCSLSWSHTWWLAYLLHECY